MILEILRTIYHPIIIKYYDITKYRDMYSNGDYGASLNFFTTCTYNHTVTVGQYQGTFMSCHTVKLVPYSLIILRVKTLADFMHMD